ncbi:prepilin peptidase [Thalassotalea sediminis]|uniref:prepilin peptidase n=1 Tax=Thalassotalea sediminis TaxID=1759089 RepID=UPI0025725360|nr:A24 family peptidase [Thalassotalea sediminis]
MFENFQLLFTEYPLSFYITIGILGLLIGSFLNVVIYRFPKMLEYTWYQECREFLADEISSKPKKEIKQITLSTPSSCCPHCQHKIRFYENVPVLSWLVLGGKCSQCKQAISKRYPIIEAVTAILSVVIAYHYGFEPITLAMLLLTWGLICLTMIDFDHMLLPDQITYPLLWLGLLININGTLVPLEQSVIGAVAGYMSLYSVFWLFKLVTGKEGMGHGDFKLFAVFGAWMGWQLLPLLILMSSFAGAIIGITLMLVKGHQRGQAIPFGPYIAIAGWVCLIWGQSIWQWYLELLH